MLGTIQALSETRQLALTSTVRSHLQDLDDGHLPGTHHVKHASSVMHLPAALVSIDTPSVWQVAFRPATRTKWLHHCSSRSSQADEANRREADPRNIPTPRLVPSQHLYHLLILPIALEFPVLFLSLSFYPLSCTL